MNDFDFKEKTNKTSYQKKNHEVFDTINQTTIKSNTKHKVLIHCQMGRSRSATLVIMYILYKHLVENVANLDVDTDTVIKYVEFCRNVCDPNAGFIKQIREFEEKCRSGEMKEILDKYHENNQ